MLTCELCNSKKIIFFHKIQNFSYFYCKNCNTLFLNPKPGDKQIKKYYKNCFEYSAGEKNENLIRKKAKTILRQLRRLNPDGNSLLDIGSGYGFFLDEALKKGFDITGIEPSKNLVNVSINQLIDTFVTRTTFTDFYNKNRNKKYDFISLIHVIEHVNNPEKTINKALNLLKPQGVLYIETPNLDSHLFRAEKLNYTFLTPPDHIWLFSKKSFKNILSKEKHSKIELISSYSSPEHFMGIIKRKLDIRYSMLDKNKRGDLRQKIINKKISFKYPVSNIKYFIFDRLLAPLFTPLLNLGIYGSILELYIRKK